MAQHLCERRPLGLVVDWHRRGQPWASEQWTVTDVLHGTPLVEPWAVLAEGPGWCRYFAGSIMLDLFVGATAEYRRNLTSSRPALYVILRRVSAAPGIAVHGITVDAGEVEVHADSGNDLIEAAPLPPFLADWVQAFVDRHHVERLAYRRQRDRADLDALGSRSRSREAQR